MKSRRQFIQRCSSALLSVAALPAVGLAAAAPRTATFTAFSKQLNTEFKLLAASGHAVNVVLERAEPYFPPNKPELANHRNFTLKFTSQDALPIGDGIHTFSHPVMGSLEIGVIETLDKTAKTHNYLAVFHGLAA